jgi:hypothetical protein
MRCRTFVFISVLAVLLILAGCAKAECKKNEQCVKPHFTGSCVDKKCVWQPIPGECGNLDCESGENECTCEQDCGACAGKSGKHLVRSCSRNNECVEDIPATAQKPITQTRELGTGGSKISATTTFNQPFNTKKDQIAVEFGINVLGPGMSDISVARLELTGMTPDRRTVKLADKTVGKMLFEGSKLTEYLIIDFPTSDKDGELTNLNLKVYLDYVVTSGTTASPKSVTLSHPYQALKFAWAMPEKSAGCPANCDDNNDGTQDFCDASTNYFCEHRPLAGACGNGLCDGTENKCSCPSDCGPCSGGGTYLSQSCVGMACLSALKPGITVQPQSVFDERELAGFTLQNSYKYGKPFNVKADKFLLEFTLYQKQDPVSSIKIKDVRLLDGSQELAYVNANKELTAIGQKQAVDVTIPSLGGSAEQERPITLRVWYEYSKDGQVTLADFSEPLGKIALVNPDV